MCLSDNKKGCKSTLCAVAVRRRVNAALWTMFAVLAVACGGDRQHAAGDGGVKCANDSVFNALLSDHVERYPRMEVVDAIKLLHHATMGSEHAIADTTAVRGWMEREWGGLGEDSAAERDPVFDSIGTRFVRVNMRGFRAAGGDSEELLRAFIETGNGAYGVGDTVQASCAAAVLVRFARSGEAGGVSVDGGEGWHWDGEAVRSAVNRWQLAGYPAVSHSAVYREMYVPAYRVVSVEYVAGLAAGGK